MIQKNVNMTEGPIFSRMVIYTLPLLLSGVLQLLYGAADVAVVGRFASNGDLALAAVGSTGSLTNLIVGLFMGLSVGACVTLSHHLGAKEEQDASEVVHTCVLSGIILGIFVSIIGIVAARPLLRIMDTPDEVLEWSSLYMRIYFIGVPASMIYNFGSAVLRAKGDTRFPLLVLIISGMVNVILNLLTVIVLKMDVAGVALATVVSQTVSAVMIIIHLCRLDDCCRLNLKKLRIHKNKLMRMVQVGLPAGIQNVLFALSNVFIQSAVNSFDTVAMAGNTAASNVDGFIYIAQNSVYHAALAFTGQNVGAKNMKRVRRIALTAVLLVTGIGISIGIIVLLFGRPLLSIYAPGKEDVIKIGLLRLEIMGTTYFLCGIMEVLTGILRGLGSSLTPMIISLIGACGLRILWIKCIFPIEYFHNLTWLYASYPISWVLTVGALGVACFIIYKITKQRLYSVTGLDAALNK